MQEIKKLGSLSIAKISGLFGVLYGFVVGVMIGVISTMYNSPTYATALGADYTAYSTMGWAALIIMPILMGVLYFIAGIVMSVIYNLFAKQIGGIEVEFAEKDIRPSSSKKK
ncbi:MAG: hypothetical protein Q7S33_02300 [Nanoarchaeota archaeon]|nr:hypothetical protein [Nanoarchaeota archaeon]